MSIWERLFGGRFTAPPPDKADVSDDEILRELHPRPSKDQKAAMRLLTELILSKLPANERERLSKRILRFFTQADDTYGPIQSGLLNIERGQKWEQTVLLSLDWKDLNHAKQMLSITASTHNLKLDDSLNLVDAISVPDLLTKFDEWLQKHNRRFLHFDSRSDNYEGTIIENDQLPDILKAANLLNIRTSLEHF